MVYGRAVVETGGPAHPNHPPRSMRREYIDYCFAERSDAEYFHMHFWRVS